MQSLSAKQAQKKGGKKVKMSNEAKIRIMATLATTSDNRSVPDADIAETLGKIIEDADATGSHATSVKIAFLRHIHRRLVTAREAWIDYRDGEDSEDTQPLAEVLDDVLEAAPTMRRTTPYPPSSAVRLRTVACDMMRARTKNLTDGFPKPSNIASLLFRHLDHHLHHITGTWERERRGEVLPDETTFRTDLMVRMDEVRWPETLCKKGSKAEALYQRWLAWFRGRRHKGGEVMAASFYTRKLFKRLREDLGFKIPEGTYVKNLRPGHWGRSAGAWSWCLRHDTEHCPDVGSCDTVKQCANAKRLTLLRFGEISAD